jgi:uncharacterized protein involved in outer membrane biogenesis
MRKLKWVAVAVVLLILLALGVLWLSLDGIIRHEVETQASISLNLPTTLGGAHLSLLGGSLGLSDLAVGSPQGFSAPQMFALGSAQASVSYGELRDNPVRIDSITLDKPKIVLEQAGGKLNLQALMGQSSAPPPSDSKGGQTMKLIINKLTVSNADVSIRPGADIPGLPAEIPITIPTIELENIGNADGAGNGAAIKDVLTQVLQAIQSKAADSDGLPPAVKALLSGNMSAITGQVKQQLGKSIDALKSGNTDAAKDALNSLIGGKKSN